MKILLTGASGFIGSHVLERLVDDNQVTLLLRKHSNTWRIETLLPKVKVVHEEALTQYFASTPPELIMHFATHYVKAHQASDVAQMIDGNVRLPTLLLEHAVRSQTQYFINIGTCFEYAQSADKLSETATIAPYNLYASTKVAFEQVLQYYAANTQLKALTLKLFYPYGEKDNTKVIQLIINAVKQQQELIISKGEQLLDFTYVHDLVDATLAAMQFIQSSKYHQYEVFNIGSGRGTHLKNIAEILNKKGKQPIVKCEREYIENEIMSMIADNSKAKKLLGWQPKTSIELGLQHMWEYYQHHEK